MNVLRSLILFFFMVIPGLIWNVQAEKPNLVFFFTDDQTSSALGCYGHPLAKTPNIDRLAKEGTRFANACKSVNLLGKPYHHPHRFTGRSYGGLKSRYGQARGCGKLM